MDSMEPQKPTAPSQPAAGKPSLLSMLTPVQLFVGGIITGLLVLCTIGFFIVLLSGGSLSFGGGSGDGNDRMNAGIPGGLPGLAKKAGVKNAKQFQSCLDEKKYASKIMGHEQDAQAAGLQGTPHSVLIAPNGDKYPIYGAQPVSVIGGLIEKLKGNTSAVSASELPTPDATISVVAVDPNTEPVRGNKDATITIVEFSDLECPFCKRFHETMKQVLQQYGNDVRWVYRHAPIDSLHSKARTEAMAVECAGEQGKFWEMTDLIFSVTPANNGLVL